MRASFNGDMIFVAECLMCLDFLHGSDSILTPILTLQVDPLHNIDPLLWKLYLCTLVWCALLNYMKVQIAVCKMRNGHSISDKLEMLIINYVYGSFDCRDTFTASVSKKDAEVRVSKLKKWTHVKNISN